MADNNIALAALALIGTLAAGFFALIRDQRASNEKSIDKLVTTLSQVAEASEKVARATEQGSREAQARNGHLGELTMQNSKLILESQDNIIKAVVNIKEQRVDHQTVERETIVGKG